MEPKERRFMVKASKWFRSIFCLKRIDSHHQPSYSKPPHKGRRRWSFLKSCRENGSSVAPVIAKNSCGSYVESPSLYVNHHQQQPKGSVEIVDPNRHAIVEAVEAAVKVVRLTSSSGSCVADQLTGNIWRSRSHSHRQIAAVMIQSLYRGHLARRALRALKGLVKFQALVRGHIDRKRAAECLRRMEALVRAQVRPRADRIRITESSRSSNKSSHFHHPRNVATSSRRTPDKNEKLDLGRNRSDLRLLETLDRVVHSTRTAPIDDEKNNKILDVVDSSETLFTIKHVI